MNNIISLICLVISLRSITAASAPMSAGSNQQLITGGTMVIDTSSSYGNTALTWNPINYTISFPLTLVAAKTVQVVAMFKSVCLFFSK